jgi:hypothetical protein
LIVFIIFLGVLGVLWYFNNNLYLEKALFKNYCKPNLEFSPSYYCSFSNIEIGYKIKTYCEFLGYTFIYTSESKKTGGGCIDFKKCPSECDEHGLCISC